MLKVTKFGGSSLSDAARLLQVRQIVLSDISRRVVVVSAAGKRHAADHKMTDLLYLCHAHLQYNVPCWDIWRRIRSRYIHIRDGCGLNTPIEEDLDAIYAALSPRTSADHLASRGEYLMAKLVADLLGYVFVDAADWLQFDAAGHVLEEASYAALRSLADGRKIVTPGFYGSLPSGAIHTFSRGGSDVTGALAAAALGADVYENWTDVDGILAADPALISEPRTIRQLRYDELQALSQVGMQVLHESAVAPVRRKNIPLQIRSTTQPNLPGTLIRPHWDQAAQEPGLVGFAGRRNLAMLRLESEAADAPQVLDLLRQTGVEVFHWSAGLGQLTILAQAKGGADSLHAAVEAVVDRLRPESWKLRENLAALALLHRGGEAVAQAMAAVEAVGVPVHHLAARTPCLLLVVNDSQFEAALKAAYAVGEET